MQNCEQETATQENIRKARPLTPFMGTRRKSRELCLQMLFQWDMGKQTPEHVTKTFWGERTEVDDSTREFADQLFQLATTRQQAIDDLSPKHAQHWKFE